MTNEQLAQLIKDLHQVAIDYKLSDEVKVKLLEVAISRISESARITSVPYIPYTHTTLPVTMGGLLCEGTGIMPYTLEATYTTLSGYVGGGVIYNTFSQLGGGDQYLTNL